MNRKIVQEEPGFQARLIASAARLVDLWAVDVLVLAEYTVDGQELTALLNSADPAYFVHSRSNQSKLAIFGRMSSVALTPGSEGTRFTTRYVAPRHGQPMLLAAVHIPDKLHWTDAGQATEALLINQDILASENSAGHRRTLLIGDFNMNPFEYGMSAAGHFHGVMTRSLAERVKRTVTDRDHHFFFNPMWSLYGDDSTGPPGSYYYAIAEPNCYFWNLYDQVLLRPDLLAFFPRERQRDNLRILTGDGTIDYLDHNGVPNAKMASDHLPILLRLEI